MEQPEKVSDQQPVEETQGIGEILSEGLQPQSEANEGGSKDSNLALEEKPTEEQVKATEEEQTPEAKNTLYGKLTIREGEELEFKSQEDFDKFVESNQILKDGFSRQSDYTKKAQAIAEETQKLEESKNAQNEFWTKDLPDNVPKTVPNEQSMTALKSLFSAYQMGNPQFQQALDGLVQQASQVVNNTGNNANPQSQEISQLRGELSTMKQRFESIEHDKANEIWNGWKSAKEQGGQKISQEIEGMMAHFLQTLDPVTKKPMSLDRSYEYAIRELGLEGETAVKKVFRNAKQVKRTTTRPASTVSSSTAKAEPNDLGGIFKQAQEDLASG